MRIIDADALTKTLDKYKLDCNHEVYIREAQVFDDCISTIQDAPTIEPRHEKWIKQESDWMDTLALCSKCKYPVLMWYILNYCPNCGADMRPDKQTQ